MWRAADWTLSFHFGPASVKFKLRVPRKEDRTWWAPTQAITFDNGETTYLMEPIPKPEPTGITTEGPVKVEVCICPPTPGGEAPPIPYRECPVHGPRDGDGIWKRADPIQSWTEYNR